MVNQSEHKRRSLFNLEGAIERLCTFKCGKEKISILMPCSYGGVAQLGEHLPCKQGVRSSILLISTSVCETNASIHVMLTTSRRLFRQGAAFYSSKKCSC